MKLTWVGHSAFLLEGSVTIAFDPWLEGNPKAALDDIKADYLFVSHDHSDHGLSDAIRISKRDGSTLVSIFEIAQFAASKGAKAEGCNIGGSFAVGPLEVFGTPAFHSSTLGAPMGFIVSVGGKTIYHAGDTSYFSEMERIGKRFSIDVALLPIGGCFTMDPEEAAHATEALRPKIAIPMHYNTFPKIVQDPKKFKDLAACEVQIMSPGQSLEL